MATVFDEMYIYLQALENDFEEFKKIPVIDTDDCQGSIEIIGRLRTIIEEMENNDTIPNIT